jgi:hypothetical protein
VDLHSARCEKPSEEASSLTLKGTSEIRSEAAGVMGGPTTRLCASASSSHPRPFAKCGRDALDRLAWTQTKSRQGLSVTSQPEGTYVCLPNTMWFISPGGGRGGRWVLGVGPGGQTAVDCHGSLCNMRRGVETHPYWILNWFGQVEAGRCGECNEGALT